MDTKMEKSKSEVSWLHHPTKLFQQPEKRPDNSNMPVTNKNDNKSLNKEESSNQQLPQTSKELQNEKTLETNDGEDEKDMNEEKIDNTSDKVHETITHDSNGEEIESKNVYEMKCLDLIQKLTRKLQSESETFCTILRKTIGLTNTENSRIKALRYDLIITLLENLLDSNTEELESIKHKLKAIFVPESVRKLYVNKNAIMELGYLGQGSSSVVFGAFLTRGPLTEQVALKKSRSKWHNEMIMSEAKILSQLDHKNIIKILAVRRDAPEIAIEYMELGNLQNAISEFNFSDKNLLTIMRDIATGMEYLHKKQYLHRDLACRNIFINAKKKCKIGDFSCSVYVGDSNGIYEEKELDPIGHNISPETLSSKVFRYQTDVWAMGMLIWHIYHIESSGAEVGFLKHIELEFEFEIFRNGNGTLRRPKRCPSDVFTFTMTHLLNRNFHNRPDFKVIKKKFKDFLVN